jgi:hypothetical protein
MKQLTTYVEWEGRGERMPDVTHQEVGRRLYHVHREKRVERAVKKIQQGMGPEWRSFTQDDIQLLGHLLQCTWNVIDQKVWDDIPFGKLTKGEVQKILSLGEGVGPEKSPDKKVVEEIKKILLAL